MKFLRINFDGDQNIGLHGFATDKYCVLGNSRYTAKMKGVLKVRAHHFTLLNLDLLRIFCTGNSSGIAMPKTVRNFDEEAANKIEKHFEVLYLDTKYTAVGSLMLINDSGAILSPLIRKHKRDIEKFFGVKCEVTTIAKMNIVGNLGFATNRGCLVHPNVKEAEKKIIEKTLGVDMDIGTVNFGSSYPGAGIIGNSNGFAVSEATSGPEMGRITDVLGFLE